MQPQQQSPYQKCVYVDQLRLGAMPEGATGEIREWFLLTKMDLRQSARGPNFALTFADRTGEIGGVWWDADYSLTQAREGDIVRIRAQLGAYQGKPQLNVLGVWKPPPGKEPPGVEHFFKASKHDPQEMFSKVGSLVDDYIEDVYLSKLVDTIITDKSIYPLLLKAPAAKAYHHAYLSGLLEHILSLMRAALALHDHYPFDLEIVLAACVLHDIGKLRELDWERGTRYTVIGNLHGHVCMGFALIDRLAEELGVDPVRTTHLLHLIASHHGLKENGAPVEPATREALIFHMLDKLDANLAALDAAMEAPPDEMGWTPYIPALKARYFDLGRADLPEPQAEPKERNDDEPDGTTDAGEGQAADPQ